MEVEIKLMAFNGHNLESFFHLEGFYFLLVLFVFFSFFGEGLTLAHPTRQIQT